MKSEAESMASSQSKRRIGTPLLSLSMILLVCAALPAAASAGPSRYVYEICDSALPGGGTPGARFVVNPGVAFTPFNTCAQSGGSIGITETGHVNAGFSYWEVSLPAPPGGTVESIAFSGSSCCAGAGTKSFVYQQGWPVNNAGETQRLFQVTGSLGGFWVFLGCDGNYAPGCEAGPSVGVHYVAATEVDPVPPKLVSVAGSLLDAAVRRGHQSLNVEASDEGGGLSKIAVSVDGLPAAQPSVANCNLAQTKTPTVVGTVAASPTPCPAILKANWTLDTSTYPFHDGANVVQVCASDFSTRGEPNTTCSAPQTVSVDNSCAESQVLGGQVLSAEFSRSHRDSVTVPYDHPAKVTGELTDNAGDSVSGATICVQAQTHGSGLDPAPLATTTTDAHGHFTYVVPAGPDRTIRLGYRHDAFQVARTIRYFAHAKPTLRITPMRVRAGQTIRLSGKVPGPRAAGRVVVEQASALHSSHWYTFDRATTNRRGVFHDRYRLDATTRSTIYRIRVVTPRQRDYPWEEGHSKPALVTVHLGI